LANAGLLQAFRDETNEVTDARNRMRACCGLKLAVSSDRFTMWEKIEAWIAERDGMAIGKLLDAALALFGAALVSESLWLLFASV